MASKIVSFTLNGRETEVMIKPLTTLQSLLRDQLRDTTTKEGCRQGGCGSCTVLVNGQPVNSCLLPVEDVAGQSVTTLKGITPAEGLHPVQEAFIEKLAMQCGYCMPGMILVAVALLQHNPNPNRDEIVEALSGNVCRCTGYEPIIQAIQMAGEQMAAPDMAGEGG